jgi:hypothetical protein
VHNRDLFPICFRHQTDYKNLQDSRPDEMDALQRQSPDHSISDRSDEVMNSQFVDIMTQGD